MQSWETNSWSQDQKLIFTKITSGPNLCIIKGRGKEIQYKQMQTMSIIYIWLDTISYPLFADADAGIYLHAAFGQAWYYDAKCG